MNKPLISILIDTYNHEAYIEQTLQSAVEQDFPGSDYEIVVVDDGSTDRTPQIVKRFAPRVRLLTKHNGGQASAFNSALPELRGEIVALLDGDDWFSRGKLSAVMKAFGDCPEAGAVSHGHYAFHEETGKYEPVVPAGPKFISLKTPDSASEALHWWKYLIVGALTVRKKVLQQTIPISESLRFCADGPIAWTAMSAGVFIFEEPLCYYRYHANNLHASVDKASVDKAEQARERRKSEMDELMFKEIERTLLRLGVAREALTASLYRVWVLHSRSTLKKFGGRRVTTFQTELRALRARKQDGKGRLDLSEYLKVPIIGLVSLMLPPGLFYKAEVWYEQRILRLLREDL